MEIIPLWERKLFAVLGDPYYLNFAFCFFHVATGKLVRMKCFEMLMSQWHHSPMPVVGAFWEA